MKKRKFGMTKWMLSEIALDLNGCAEEKQVLEYGVSQGINLVKAPVGWQTAKWREILDGFLKQEGGELVIAMDLPASLWKGEAGDPKGALSMVNLPIFRGVETEDDLVALQKSALFLEASDRRKKGGCGVAVSCQHPRLARQIAERGLADGLFLIVHPIYDLLDGDVLPSHAWDEENFTRPYLNMQSDRQRLYEVCTRLRIGIVAEDVTGGGRLLQAETSPGKKALSLLQCMHYSLQRPGVCSVLMKAGSSQELEQILSYETATHQERDFASGLVGFEQMTWRGRCMYCENCQPCPMKVEITPIMQVVNLMNAQDTLPEVAREMYRGLECGARTCFDCGTCETRCPFGVPIRVNLKRALDTFDEN